MKIIRKPFYTHDLRLIRPFKPNHCLGIIGIGVIARLRLDLSSVDCENPAFIFEGTNTARTGVPCSEDALPDGVPGPG